MSYTKEKTKIVRRKKMTIKIKLLFVFRRITVNKKHLFKNKLVLSESKKELEKLEKVSEKKN